MAFLFLRIVSQLPPVTLSTVCLLELGTIHGSHTTWDGVLATKELVGDPILDPHLSYRLSWTTLGMSWVLWEADTGIGLQKAFVKGKWRKEDCEPWCRSGKQTDKQINKTSARPRGRCRGSSAC